MDAIFNTLYEGYSASVDDDEFYMAQASLRTAKAHRFHMAVDEARVLDAMHSSFHLMMSSLPMKALAFGLLSSLSLPMGAFLGDYFSPVKDEIVGGMMAFGSGALLFAVTVELYGQSLHEAHKHPGASGQYLIFTTIGGAVCGALGYLYLNLWLEDYMEQQEEQGAEEDSSDDESESCSPRGSEERGSEVWDPTSSTDSTVTSSLRLGGDEVAAGKKQQQERHSAEPARTNSAKSCLAVDSASLGGPLRKTSSEGVPHASVKERKVQIGEEEVVDYIERGSHGGLSRKDRARSDNSEERGSDVRRIVSFALNDDSAKMCKSKSDKPSIKPRRAKLGADMDAPLSSASFGKSISIRKSLSVRVHTILAAKQRQEPGTQGKQASGEIKRADDSDLDEEEKSRQNKGLQVAMAVFLGVLADGVPEAVLMGFLIGQDSCSLVLIVALFVANFPEAFSSASLMAEAGISRSTTIGMWTGLCVLSGVLSGGACWGLLLIAPTGKLTLTMEFGVAGIEGLAGGGMIACIAGVMLPEAFERAAKRPPIISSGFLCCAGFLASVGLKVLGGDVH